MNVIEQHPAVSKDAKPHVIVDELGAATVNIKVLYWFDISECSRIKVRSSFIRQVKNALVKAGISMLDEAREVVFPKRVPVEMKSEAVGKTQTPKENNPDESKIEDNFKSDSETVEKQGKRAKQPEGTENFLK